MGNAGAAFTNTLEFPTQRPDVAGMEYFGHALKLADSIGSKIEKKVDSKNY